MKSWKDVLAAVAAVTVVSVGIACSRFAAEPMRGGLMVAHEEPVHLLPACDYYPHGLNGEPCVNGP